MHCDVTAGRSYWLLPQLDASVVGRLDSLNDDQSVTLHLPVTNELPASKAAFVEALQRADAALSVRAARRVRPTLVAELGEQVLGSDAEEAIRAFQSHSDALRLTQAYGRAVAGDLDKAFKLIDQLLEAPGSALEDKFRAWLIWEMAELNRQIAAGVSDRESCRDQQPGRPRTPGTHQDGPTHLKYYAAVFALAARVSALAHDGHALAHGGTSRGPGRAHLPLVTAAVGPSARLDAHQVFSNRQSTAPDKPSFDTTEGAASSGDVDRRRVPQIRARGAQRPGSEPPELTARTLQSRRQSRGHDRRPERLASTASSALVLLQIRFRRRDDLRSEIAGQLTSPDERAFVERAIDQRRRMNAGERIEGKIKTTARQIAENVEDGLRLVQRQHPPQADSNQPES